MVPIASFHPVSADASVQLLGVQLFVLKSSVEIVVFAAPSPIPEKDKSYLESLKCESFFILNNNLN